MIVHVDGSDLCVDPNTLPPCFCLQVQIVRAVWSKARDAYVLAQHQSGGYVVPEVWTFGDQPLAFVVSSV